MILVSNVDTPFTIEAKVLVVVEREFELIIVVVPIDPAKLEVNVFVAELRVLEAFKLVTVRLVVVELIKLLLVALRLFVLTVPELIIFELITEESRLVKTKLVVVEFPSRSDLKDVFSVQARPFQTNVVLVAVPVGKRLLRVTHFVDVPVEIRYCPFIPATPVLSRSP